MARSVLTPEERLENWRIGVEYFNSGQYWEAHEAWEKGWLTLPAVEKLHIQALIQTAGALHLFGKGRSNAGRRLVESALKKLAERDSIGPVEACFPRIEIPDHVRILEGLLDHRVEPLKSVQSRLLLSPP